MLLCLPLLSQQLQLCASPPLFCVFGVSFHPPGFLLRLLSCAPSTLYSTWVFFFFLVSFLWFWVSLSSFLLLSPLLEPSLLFFFVVCQVPAGGRSCNTTQKKKDLTQTANDPVQLQKMLRHLESYAARKRLTVNVQKSYIVNFNVYRNSAVPVFRPY